MIRGLATMSWISFSSTAVGHRVIGVAEGERGVVAVEDGHRAAGPHDAARLAEHLDRVVDVADQGVHRDDVELAVGVGRSCASAVE